MKSRLIGSRFGLRIFVLYVLAAGVPTALLAYLSREAIDSAVHDATRATLASIAKSTSMSVIDRLQLAQHRLSLGSIPEERPSATIFESTATLAAGDALPFAAAGTAEALALSKAHSSGPAGGRDALTVVASATPGRPSIWMVHQNGEEQTVGRIAPAFLFADLGEVPPGTWACLLGPVGERLFCSDNAPDGVGSANERLAAQTVQREVFLGGTLTSAPWRTVAGVDPDAEGRFDGLSTVTMKVALASILLAALLSLTQIRRLLGPLDSLIRGTKAIALGRFDEPIQTRSDDEFGMLATTFNDMAAQLKGRMAELAHLARTDSLTGLLNRLGLRDELERRIARCQAERSALAVLFIDLDRFKSVNDTLGHGAGDAVLRDVADRCLPLLQPGCILTRPAGDEFVVILDGPSPLEAAVTTGEAVCQALAVPFSVGTSAFFLGASVGVAAYPVHGQDAETLILNGDAAMYRSKREGRGRLSVFDGALDGRGRSEHVLELDLRRALEADDELALYYQPRIGTAEGRITSVEALIRWNRRGVGWVTPGDFIPVAERSDLIVAIGDWVIDTACRQARRWRDEGVQNLTVAVNVSARQLHNGELPVRLLDAVRKHGIPASCIEIEVTESLLVADLASVSRLLERVRAAGFGVALDDFGTGFSSLSYLRQLPFDIIKIDRSFVMDTDGDATARAIAQSIVALAKTLGKRTVAEGIETAEQGRWLTSIGCDELQGFYYGKPAPADSLALSRPRETLLAAQDGRQGLSPSPVIEPEPATDFVTVGRP